MSISLPTYKPFEVQQWALSLLQMQTATVQQVMLFVCKANFVPVDMQQLFHLCPVIQSDMLTIIVLLLTYFVLLPLFLCLH